MRAMNGGWRVHLSLGRVSNLPTVWSNVAAAAVLAGAAMGAASFAWLALAMSAFYVGGMYLNDAFDRHVDAVERPERPIPAGRITAAAVFGIGFALLMLGWTMTAVLVLFAEGRLWALGSAAALGACIVIYDAWHKNNPWSPFVMGMCRVLVYLTAAHALGGALGARVVVGALVLLGYLIGLTYAAKQENLGRIDNMWPLVLLAGPIVYAAFSGTLVAYALAAALALWIARAVRLLRARRIPLAIGSLIAGIGLVDATLAAAAGASEVAFVAALALPATLFFQRYVAGT